MHMVRDKHRIKLLTLSQVVTISDTFIMHISPKNTLYYELGIDNTKGSVVLPQLASVVHQDPIEMNGENQCIALRKANTSARREVHTSTGCYRGTYFSVNVLLPYGTI